MAKIFHEKSRIIRRIATNLFVVISISFVAISGARIANAATLGFSPSTLSRTVGSTFSVFVYVSSADQATNAVSGVISFPTDKLQAVSVSKTNSVINLWVQEPTFSNTQGTVNFEGIALNPGYTGSQGTIITITFRTKSSGQANIKFSSGSVLANDGIGTNVLTGLGNANISIKAIPPPQDISADESISDTNNKAIDSGALLETPIITYYQEEVKSGDFIKIQGIANPGADIKIRLLRSGESIQQKIIRSTGSGNFVVVIDPISDPGVYTFIAQAIDEVGNMSSETSPFTIVVKQKWLNQLLESIFNYLSLTMLIGLALIGVSVCAVFLWYRLLTVIRRIGRESQEAEKVLEKSFNILRKDINEHITRLKTAKSKRKLSSEEIAFLKRFEEELAEAKDVIAKEVQDISHS